MDLEDDPLFFYNKKIQEFDLLLHESKSSTLTSLVLKAKDYAHAALQDLLVIQRGIVEYLKQYKEKQRNKIENYRLELTNLESKFKALESAYMPAEAKKIAKSALSNQAETLQKKLNFEGHLNALVNTTHQSVAKSLSDVLLKMIFKPDNEKFNYERIIDVINYIVEQKIPLLGEAKMVLGFSNKAKLKKQIESSNDLLIYLERFIDVLERWATLSGNYMKIIVDELAPSN